MFVASVISSARPIAVLLGGEGKATELVARRKHDGCALLAKPSCRTCVPGVTPLSPADLRQIGYRN